MSRNFRTVHRQYSFAFKSQVVQDIESGRLTISEAAKLHDIGGHSTIQKWLDKFGSKKSPSRVVRVETPDEVARVKALNQDKRQLESALAQAELKIICLEDILEKASIHYGKDIKKNFGMKV